MTQPYVRWAWMSQVLNLKRVKRVARCNYCREPTLWRTPGGTKVCITCLRLRPLDEGERAKAVESEVEAIYNLAAGLGVKLIPTPPPEPPGPIRLITGPCSWCGQPGLKFTVDDYLHCKAHTWPPYRWPGNQGVAA